MVLELLSPVLCCARSSTLDYKPTVTDKKMVGTEVAKKGLLFLSFFAHLAMLYFTLCLCAFFFVSGEDLS